MFFIVYSQAESLRLIGLNVLKDKSRHYCQFSIFFLSVIFFPSIRDVRQTKSNLQTKVANNL